MTERNATQKRGETQPKGADMNDFTRNAFRSAIQRMRDSGYDIGDRVEMTVDPRLPIMGYTLSGEGGRFQITVSGGAVKSGLLEGLLTHEMSHIYRMRTNHPSHNPRIIEEATNEVAGKVVTKDYQRKILHDLVNNVEDLYADDISWRVIRKAGILTEEQSTEFLQNWVEDRPAESRDATRVRWENAWTLANNARAIAQMTRHGVADTGGRATVLSERFLSQMKPSARSDFEYFRNLLANLKEPITEEEYRAFLVDYLGRFIEVAAA